MGDQQVRDQAIDPTISVCVTAPAGSGKTALLTQRFLALMPRVSRLEQVLAITFTRKAAAEMRERILGELDAARQNETVTTDFERQIRTLALKALAHADRAGWSLQADSFNIRTIDSLSAYLTRHMPILSESGGAMQTVDDASPLYEAAVKSLFQSAASNDATGEALRALLSAYQNNWQRLAEMLVLLLGKRGDWAKILGHHRDPEAAQHSIQRAVSELISARIADASGTMRQHFPELEKLAHGAAETISELQATGKSGAKTLPPPESLPLGLNDDARDLESWQFVAALVLTQDGKVRKGGGVNVNLGFPVGTDAAKQQKQRFIDCLDAIREDAFFCDCLIELRRLPRMDTQSSGWQLVLHLSHLLPVLQAHLLLIFRQQARVDHNHVALAAEAGLGNDDAPTDLALRLDYQLEHILVDEFQDTSFPQFRLLERLTRGWADHNQTAQSPRTLFIVGDGMQSIYGFRDANVELFLRARRQGISGIVLNPLALTRNFRSQAGIVDWVNALFSRLFPATDDPAKGAVSHSIAEPTVAGLAGDSAFIHLFSEAQGRQEADFIAAQIAALGQQEPDATIAILGRTRSSLQAVIAALKRLSIPFNGRDLDPLGESPAVVDLMSLCRWLANPADNIAALALLRAPWCGLQLVDINTLLQDAGQPFALLSVLAQADDLLDADNSARARHLHAALVWALEKRDRLSLGIWIEQVWHRLAMPSTLPEARLSDARAFFTLLREAEELGKGLDIQWLEYAVSRLYARQSELPCNLELLTLHKAKGLEFDYVFLPQLQRSPRSDSRQLLHWSLHQSAAQASVLIAADDGSDGKEGTLYNYLGWLRGQRAEAERRRLLYVGITRARRRVWLSGEVKAEGTEFQLPGERSLLGLVCANAGTHIEFHEAEGLTDSDAGVEKWAGSLHRLQAPPVASVAESIAGLGPISPGTSFQVELNSNRMERGVGTVLHRALELLAGEPALPATCPEYLVAAIRFNLQQFGILSQTLMQAEQRVVELVNNTLADEAGRWILMAREDAHCELAITPCDGESESIIDRTFHDFASGQRWIIDYKTSAPHDSQDFTSFCQLETDRYRNQLKRYVSSVSALFGIQDPIRCGLYLPAIPALIEVSFDA